METALFMGACILGTGLALGWWVRGQFEDERTSIEFEVDDDEE